MVKAPFTNIVLLDLGEPKQGDTVVFRFSLDHTKDFIKRVVAKGGDTVEIRDKMVYVNERRYIDGSARFATPQDIPAFLSSRDNLGPVLVPRDSYFVMGDNRDDSYDSRFWGFVKRDDLIGKVEVVYFSPDHNAGPLHAVRWERVRHLIE